MPLMLSGDRIRSPWVTEGNWQPLTSRRGDDRQAECLQIALINNMPDAALEVLRCLVGRGIVRGTDLAAGPVLQVLVDDLLDRLFQQIDDDRWPVFAAGVDVRRVPLVAGPKPHPPVEGFALFAFAFDAVMPVAPDLFGNFQGRIVFGIRHYRNRISVSELSAARRINRRIRSSCLRRSQGNSA